MALGSCTVENPTSQDTLPSAQNEQSFSRTNETPAMGEFKEALTQLARANALERRNGGTKSMFAPENTDAFAANAKTFLLAAGYSEMELKELDNRMLFLKALKKYAHLSQSKPTN